ncbi:MAG: site-specific integrase [Acidobacteriia bacterium]|nr:site-specific integrase [Terriglobia bacterium]
MITENRAATSGPDKAGRVWCGDGIFSKRHKNGREWFYIRYPTTPGHRRVEKAGLKASQARRLLRKRLGQVASEQYRDPRDVVRAVGPTFQKFAARFLAEHPGRRRSNHYPVNVRELVKHFGARRLKEITRADLDAYRLALETTARPGRVLGKRKQKELNRERAILPPLSPTTILKRLRVLHRMFRLAVRWGVVDRNPAADLEKPAASKGRTRYLTREEFDRLEATAPPWVRPFLRLAVSTGMRLGELAQLTWGDVDFSAGVLHVPMDTKTGTRTVPMSEAAKAVLEDLRSGRAEQAKELNRLSLHVLVDASGQDYSSSERRSWVSETTRKASVGAGLERLGLHVLRHTFASWAVHAGEHLSAVQKVLGHSSPILTERYVHLAPQHLRGVATAVDRVLGTDSATQAATQDQTGADRVVRRRSNVKHSVS